MQARKSATVGRSWLPLLMTFIAAIPGVADSPAEEDGMTLTSSAFVEGGPIPSQHTCDGANTSPPLSWANPPAATKSFALICDDPDAPAGTWVHWVFYDIPTKTVSLPEAIPSESRPDVGGVQGTNDFRRTGYGGPCPPGGSHRYFFKLYALDAVLNLSPGATKRQLLQAMEGHVLAQAELMGTYRRQSSR